MYLHEFPVVRHHHGGFPDSRFSQLDGSRKSRHFHGPANVNFLLTMVDFPIENGGFSDWKCDVPIENDIFRKWWIFLLKMVDVPIENTVVSFQGGYLKLVELSFSRKTARLWSLASTAWRHCKAP